MKRVLALFLFLNIIVGGPGLVAHAKEIAVIWDTKSAMVTTVNMGLLAKLRELAPDLKDQPLPRTERYGRGKKDLSSMRIIDERDRIPTILWGPVPINNTT